MAISARIRVASAAFTLLLLRSGSVGAQVTPAAGYTPPDDSPRINLGTTLWSSYTAQTEPEITDAAGNSVNRSAFDVGRPYINITGQLSHIVAFRITPDITRESGLNTAATVTNDSLVFRTNYAFGQSRRLDDQRVVGASGDPADALGGFRGRHLPLYRFQGTVFAERV